MTALVSMFNFLIVFIRYFVFCVVGGRFSVEDFLNPEQQELARNIIIQITNGAFEKNIYDSGEPLLILFIGIIVIGSIIGLAKRLIRG